MKLNPEKITQGEILEDGGSELQAMNGGISPQRRGSPEEGC